MISNLSYEQIENLLHQQVVGRIACHYEDEIYIVPISYAYDGKYIYCHAYEGRKMEMMRKNSKVCFQVDEMKDMANWTSVIAWGNFEELTDPVQRNKALRILLNRPLPILSSITTHLGDVWPFSANDAKGIDDIPGIVFRISLQEKTGKFERTSESPALMFN